MVSCKFCRQNFCKTFEIGKEYIENFIKDFLNLSDQTIESNYKVIIKRIPVEKTSQVKSYVKSIKNRTQVINQRFVDCEKLN